MHFFIRTILAIVQDKSSIFSYGGAFDTVDYNKQRATKTLLQFNKNHNRIFNIVCNFQEISFYCYANQFELKIGRVSENLLSVTKQMKLFCQHKLKYYLFANKGNSANKPNNGYRNVSFK